MKIFNELQDLFSSKKTTKQVSVTVPLNSELMENLIYIRQQFNGSADLLIREFVTAGHKAAVISCENMVDKLKCADLIKSVVTLKESDQTPDEFYIKIRDEALQSIDQLELENLTAVLTLAMSGFLVLMIDGVNKAIALGLQGFSVRSVSEPTNEVSEYGTREGFIDALRLNMAIIRRRFKNTQLKFEVYSIGTKSNTDVSMIYIEDTVSKEVLDSVRERLINVNLEVLLDSTYLRTYFEGDTAPFFSSVGITERPDTLIAKLNEGRVGILVDGTPFALIVPYLLLENLQTFDDYANKAVYVTLIRWVKYLCLFISMYLPAIYIATSTFHQEIFPTILFTNLLKSQLTTPFTVLVEGVAMMVIYEIMREAGLRLPRPLGSAVGIVGSLIVGETAVKAGIVSSPMVMVVALSAIASYVIPSLYTQVAIIRMAMILLAGFTGFYGITMLTVVIFFLLVSKTSFGVPYFAPLAPFDTTLFRDFFLRLSWKQLAKHPKNVQSLSGSVNDPDNDGKITK